MGRDWTRLIRDRITVTITFHIFSAYVNTVGLLLTYWFLWGLRSL